MASFQLIAPMPALTLESGYIITFEAINPDSGAAVTGVRISQATLYGVNFAPDTDQPTPQEDEAFPLFVPIPRDEAA